MFYERMKIYLFGPLPLLSLPLLLELVLLFYAPSINVSAVIISHFIPSSLIEKNCVNMHYTFNVTHLFLGTYFMVIYTYCVMVRIINETLRYLQKHTL